MTVPTEDLLAALAATRVLPVLRTPTAAASLALAGPLVGAGLVVLELTTTTDGWESAVERARSEWPHVLVGVGTVTTADLAERALGAGAAFLVSPYPVEEVRACAERAGAGFLPGAFTPAEVAAEAPRGPVKVFPAHVGGPAYVTDLLAVLPHARIVPTGGVRVDDVEAYLAAGALAVGVGSDLHRPGRLDRLAALLDEEQPG